MNKGAFVEGFMSELEKIGIKAPPSWLFHGTYGLMAGMGLMQVLRAAQIKRKTGKPFWRTLFQGSK